MVLNIMLIKTKEKGILIMPVPQSNIEADKLRMRRNMKEIARNLRNAGDQVTTALQTILALGINYDSQTESEGTNGVFAFSEIQAVLNTHKTNLAKLADIGDSI